MKYVYTIEDHLAATDSETMLVVKFVMDIKISTKLESVYIFKLRDNRFFYATGPAVKIVEDGDSYDCLYAMDIKRLLSARQAEVSNMFYLKKGIQEEYTDDELNEIESNLGLE